MPVSRSSVIYVEYVNCLLYVVLCSDVYSLADAASNAILQRKLKIETAVQRIVNNLHYLFDKLSQLNLSYLAFLPNFFALNEYQVNFGFLPAKSQILIRTASFFTEVYRIRK